MGSTCGNVSVHEPCYTVLLEVQGPKAGASYELRRYGERFVAETSSRLRDKDGTAFKLLAAYIGLCGDPQNEEKEVITTNNSTTTNSDTIRQKRAPMDMMALVVTKNDNDTGETTMQFLLPPSYDDISKIPNPTNPKVRIRKLPPALGAVHCFRGPFSQQSARYWASKLADQLLANGLVNLSKDDVMANCQLWGYNPPHTIPLFRRNEVWVELTEDQANSLIQNFGGPAEPNLMTVQFEEQH